MYCPTSYSVQQDASFKGARLEEVRSSQEKVACIYLVLGGSTGAVLGLSLAQKVKVLTLWDTDCHGLGNCLPTEHGAGRHHAEPELQRERNFCWGFCPHPNISLCLFWYLSMVHWATSKMLAWAATSPS